MKNSIDPIVWSSIKLLLLASVTFLVYKIVNQIINTYQVRGQYRDIRSLPRHWVWGNVVNSGEKLSPGLNRHPDYGFEEIWKDLDQPSCFLVDLEPVSTSFLIVADPIVAEQIAQPSKEFKYSVPKSDTMGALVALVGKESLITAEHEEWKILRKRFNRGFAPSHLHGLNPLIVEKTRVFIDRLEARGRSGDAFAMKELAQDLTTDIITQLAMEADFKAQSTPEGEGTKSLFGILTASRILSSLVNKTAQGIDALGWLDPVRPVKEFVYEKTLNRKIRRRLYQILGESAQSTKRPSTSKAIVQLALADTDITPTMINSTVSQIKSFLFAGQDTTATIIQWMCFELSQAKYSTQHSQILSRLQEEHTSVFGSGKYSALDVLSKSNINSENILNSQLPYTTAFVRETLRLHPPAGTARLVPRAKDNTTPPFTIDIENTSTRIDGLRVYNCQWLIHRNPKIWGPDALTFRPERWLDEAYISSLPAGSWRPFERGPRNCIGQELALIELKVLLCAVARGFEFEKVGNTGRNGEREVWNINQVTSVPCDGMVMRVRKRND